MSSESPFTPEQLERMHRNRQRALELQAAARKRKEEEEEQQGDGCLGTTKDKEKETEPKRKRVKTTSPEAKNDDKTKKQDNDDVLLLSELEDFEVGASEFVTKQEAMKVYLVSEGTLSVCEFVERPNPRHEKWTAMKLYHRSEIRKRARERWGGLAGLIQERQRRQEERFRNDLKKAQRMFDT